MELHRFDSKDKSGGRHKNWISMSLHRSWLQMLLLTNIIHTFQANQIKIRQNMVIGRFLLPIANSLSFCHKEAKAPMQSGNEREYSIPPYSCQGL